MTFSRQHAVVAALLLSALATQISSLDHWSDILHPAFVAGVFGIVSANLLAVFSDKPEVK